ncbi:MAG: sulfite exporter TauE/SafE family protein [Ignavibacteria bacterium]|nr:sulfite exporter TauE/SafE family protein [Ignavibacteria bacterium]
MTTELIVAFVFGVAGSLHCVAMCGPILLAMPRIEFNFNTVLKKSVYHFSRISVYALLGGFVGLGALVADIAGFGQIVSVTAGILMIVVASIQLFSRSRMFSTSFFQRATIPFREYSIDLLKRKSMFAHVGLGALNGLLPCGLVVAALFGAATMYGPLNAMYFMIAFGAGTIPSLLVLQFGVAFLPRGAYAKMRKVIPVVALCLGALLVVRGMHLGIPYMSPKAPLQNNSAESSCVDSVIKTK